MTDARDIVEVIRQRAETSVLQDGITRLPSEDFNTLISTIASLRKQLEDARAEADTLRHWAFNHVDAMLLYTSYPEDSHVKEAVEFCKIIAPDRILRMGHLQGSGWHPAREALKGKS